MRLNCNSSGDQYTATNIRRPQISKVREKKLLGTFFANNLFSVSLNLECENNIMHGPQSDDYIECVKMIVLWLIVPYSCWIQLHVSIFSRLLPLLPLSVHSKQFQLQRKFGLFVASIQRWHNSETTKKDKKTDDCQHALIFWLKCQTKTKWQQKCDWFVVVLWTVNIARKKRLEVAREYTMTQWAR